MMTASTVLVAALAIAAPAQQQNLNKAHTFKGKPAPTFNGTTTDGANLTSANLRGKVVLLDFWATWCGPCKAASPTMQSLHTKYFGEGLRVVAVSGGKNFEQDVTARPIAAYKNQHKYGYSFVYNNDKAFTDYGITSIPQFVLIGKDGRVAETWEGFTANTSPARIEAAVKAALAK